ncbi:MAG: hypothetical protein HY282_16230 [Nitrospirae bacterium]|nr:hypothetical protein [Candidatus Manganitrophaceae bacterium]
MRTTSASFSLFLLLFLSGCTPFGIPALYEKPAAHFENRAIDESSGLVKSRRLEEVFWTHNDSGDRARIFAVTREGQDLGTVEVRGAQNVDWEDLAIDDAGFLYLCDIGDNRGRRHDLVIYKIPEVDPRRVQETTVAARFPFHYPDHPPIDAEACFYAGGAFYVMTKERAVNDTTLYRLDLSRPDQDQAATFVGRTSIESLVTGADVTPDGTLLAVLSYPFIDLYRKPADNDNYLAGPHRRTWIYFGQAEGIAWDGADLLISDEEGNLLRRTGLRRP